MQKLQVDAPNNPLMTLCILGYGELRKEDGSDEDSDFLSLCHFRVNVSESFSLPRCCREMMS